jgi:hypothetical protein
VADQVIVVGDQVIPWFALLIQWALVVSGCIYFVTDSAIFASSRIALAKGSWFRTGLLYCGGCLGFWAGAGLSGFWPLELEATLPSSVFGWAIPWLEHRTVPLTWLVSGIAGMALGALWKTHVPNTAYETEKVALGLE